MLQELKIFSYKFIYRFISLHIIQLSQVSNLLSLIGVKEVSSFVAEEVKDDTWSFRNVFNVLNFLNFLNFQIQLSQRNLNYLIIPCLLVL